MKKLCFFLFLSLIGLRAASAKELDLNHWLKLGPIKANMPVFAETGNVDGEKFTENDLLLLFDVNPKHLSPELDAYEAIGQEELLWSELIVSADSLIHSGMNKNNILLLATYVSIERWTQANLKISLNARYELYVNGKCVKEKKIPGTNADDIQLKLETGKHQFLLKILSDEGDLKLNASFSYSEVFDGTNPLVSLSSKRSKNIQDVLNANSLVSALLSPSGTYALLTYSESSESTGKTKKLTILRNLKTGENEFVFRNAKLSQLKWLPSSDRLSYVQDFNAKKEIYIYDVNTKNETLIGSNIEALASYNWAPNERFIVFSMYKKAEEPNELKRIFGAEDRLPYFRDRSFLYYLDVKSGSTFPITAGNLSASLHDIHPEANKIIFSTSTVDYSEVPFSKQNLYELDLNTFVLDEIWKDKSYGASVTYSPDGKKILVQGAPLTFGEIGENIEKGQLSNSYDSQLYIYTLSSKEVEPLSVDFDPSVNQAFWKSENELYVSVSERDYINLYQYDFRLKEFKHIPLQTEVLASISFAKFSNAAIYTGTSISTPQKLFLLDLKKTKSSLIDYPAKATYESVDFGMHKEYNFTNSKGTKIYGRVYFPPNYIEGKKYPVIVYYYGGTSPVERNFGGRYPKNVWAANGYIVYVLQPSGATGFGQKFSALHVNGWGKEAIDDIIEGTKKFLAEHNSADAENVGCIGASYGGYTTMLLQTRTDLFKTAISHAGISSITSYWGEGYWGYTYSSGATKNSYPWNRKDIYVENSPLYNAHKFQNSILLLHGTDDTNVPVGESKQFYLALKLLGKNVEMVLVDGEDHWVIDYKKRLAWHNTIISWFDKELKNQPQQWKDMFPDKNL